MYLLIKMYLKFNSKKMKIHVGSFISQLFLFPSKITFINLFFLNPKGI